MYTFHLFQFKEVCNTVKKVFSLILWFCPRLVRLRAPAQSREVVTGLFITRGRSTPLEVSTLPWMGLTPTWRGTSTGRTANPSLRSVHRITSTDWQGLTFTGAVGTKFDNTEVDKVTNEGGHSRTIGEQQSFDFDLLVPNSIGQPSGFTHSSGTPVSPWSDAGLRWNRSSFWFDNQQHCGRLPAGDPAVLQTGRGRRSWPPYAPLWAGGHHGPGAGPVLHGGGHQRVQLLHGRQCARPSEFPSSLAVPLSAVWT